MMEKVSLALSTILHEDCRSFLHRSQLSGISAMLSGGSLLVNSYQDSLHTTNAVEVIHCSTHACYASQPHGKVVSELWITSG